MRTLGFWILFLAAGAALSLSRSGGNVGDTACTSRGVEISVPVKDSAYTSHGIETALPIEGVTAMITNRKLKERSYSINTAKSTIDFGRINLEDYPRFDPVPSSRAAITAGPIEHGTPLMPYVPRPTPPNHPKNQSP
ncbi:uncharacterized protein LOC103705283 isoform X1 [Phoenix dactylifera]|uniref:Uncharacterized protein LOC103705283 isoform X1 n=1 Tax=Phoenix dactylifera TaxID=42345 RepID=A0A8B7BX24_PHODC|nr:uncharacterized protein LOC103705283 isoform X1 [Phoenix dactylifera]